MLAVVAGTSPVWITAAGTPERVSVRVRRGRRLVGLVDEVDEVGPATTVSLCGLWSR